MSEDLLPYLSAKASGIMREFKRLGSMEALRAAHPEITDADVAEVTAQVAGAMALMLEKRPAKKPRARRTQSASLGGNAYQLKIVLRGSGKPPIWRRVVAPSGVTLYWLHVVIQVAMGWDDDHLHRFVIGSRQFSGNPLGEYDADQDGGNETERRLGELVRREKAKFTYLYDFGDNWLHEITLEKIVPAEEAPGAVICTAGKGACPPEDSGGVWGYYMKLDILKNPRHSDYEDISEWMGKDFDPAAFDLDDVNRRLGRLKV